MFVFEYEKKAAIFPKLLLPRLTFEYLPDLLIKKKKKKKRAVYFMRCHSLEDFNRTFLKIQRQSMPLWISFMPITDKT
jgi:hypothetical protein